MKKFVCICIVLFSFLSCKKSTTGTTPVATEENIVFETSAGSNAINASSTYDFKVTLKSKMPANGIRIEVTAIDEATGASVAPQASAITSTTAITNASVQNLPRQKWVEATVRVSSVSTATNTAINKFRVIFK